MVAQAARLPRSATTPNGNLIVHTANLLEIFQPAGLTRENTAGRRVRQASGLCYLFHAASSGNSGTQNGDTEFSSYARANELAEASIASINFSV